MQKVWLILYVLDAKREKENPLKRQPDKRISDSLMQYVIKEQI
jgi:hypothetical protein